LNQAQRISTLLTSEDMQNNSLTPGYLLRNRERNGTKLLIRNANCLLLVTSIAMDKISNVVMWCINDQFSVFVNFVISIDTCTKCQFIFANLSSYCSEFNYYSFSTVSKEKWKKIANTPITHKQTMPYSDKVCTDCLAATMNIHIGNVWKIIHVQLFPC